MGCGASAERRPAVGGAHLASHAPDQKGRADAIAKARGNYQWQYAIADLPPYMTAIPACEETHATKVHDGEIFKNIIGTSVKLRASKMMSDLKGLFQDKEPFDEWKEMLHGDRGVNRGVPFVGLHDRWKEDEEFGWQKMNGLNPSLIRRCSKLPATFPVTDAVLDGLIGEHKLSELMQSGRVFLSNYEDLDGITTPKERCSYAGYVLLWSNDDKKLMPLAIQLAIDSSKSPIYTPKDGNNWLAAKVHAQVSEFSMHEVSAHLLATHLIMEAVYVSMKRQLSVEHPVHILMQQHFFFTININHQARTSLVAEGGPVPKLMALGYDGTFELIKNMNKAWTFERFNIPYNIKRRGVGCKDTLPQFLWRDDALKMWEIIMSFVAKILAEFYLNDQDVAEDTELAAWVAEMTAELGENGCGFKGLPVGGDGKMQTREQLVLFLTMLIYNCSGGHSAVNNGQYDILGFIPNMPARFELPREEMAASKKDGKEVTLLRIKGCMPKHDASVEQIVMVHVLSTVTDDELGSYDDNDFFVTDKVLTIVDGFKKDLRDMTVESNRRNKRLDESKGKPGTRGYRYLVPEQIAQGIAI